MTRRDPEPPDFVREAVDSDAIDLRSLDALPALLEPSPPPPALRRRLLDAVAGAEHRYAPFTDRLCELWDMPEREVTELLTRAGDGSGWRRSPLPGVRTIDVAVGPARGQARGHLIRFRAGLRYPRHRHLGPERVLLLEGGYVEDTGRSFGPGDWHEMGPGLEHGFRIHADQACICAAVQEGFEFTGPALRLFQRLFGERYGKH